MKHRIFSAFLTVAAVAVLATSSFAGSVSASSTVTINYTGACTISATSPVVAFGGGDASSSADITVTCSTGLPWTLAAGPGLNASGELRRAKLGSDYLTYRLFKDSGLTQEVGVTSNTVATGTGTNAAQVQTAYLAIKAADNTGGVPVGAYAETLGWDLVF